MHVSLVFAILLITLSKLANAEPPIAERPAYKVGDSWTYQRTQTRPPIGDRSTPIMTRKILDITPEGNFRTGNPIGLNFFDSSFDVISPHGEEYKRTLFKFPMAVGNKWNWTRKVYPMYPDVAEFGSFEVEAFETIAVPAGRFECFRIYGDMRMTGRYVGSWTRITIWYCPAIRHIGKQVRTIIETGIYNTESLELLSSTSLVARN